jgi:glycosyltransferase involved in cell wall biosynthesis
MRHKPETHVLAQMAENCLKQTFQDFELIVVDLVWAQRPRYLEENFGSLGFPVLHIPDKSSIFRDLNLIRICSARNTGLMYARGQCVVFTDDCQEWTENAFERLHAWGKNNVGATVRLHRDNGKGPIEVDSRWEAYGIEGTLRTKCVPAAGIGYLGGSLSMVPTLNMLECNGWDEMFDGGRQLEDSDMAKRLGVTGLKMALEGHAGCVEFSQQPCSGHIMRTNTVVKCNGAYIYPIWEAEPKRVRANDHIVPDEDLDTFLDGECPMLRDGNCKNSGDKCEGGWNRRSLMGIYQDPRMVFDMAELRAQRTWETVSTDPLLEL